jgi:hypothetical protein
MWGWPKPAERRSSPSAVGFGLGIRDHQRVRHRLHDELLAELSAERNGARWLRPQRRGGLRFVRSVDEQLYGTAGGGSGSDRQGSRRRRRDCCIPRGRRHRRRWLGARPIDRQPRHEPRCRTFEGHCRGDVRVQRSDKPRRPESSRTVQAGDDHDPVTGGFAGGVRSQQPVGLGPTRMDGGSEQERGERQHAGCAALDGRSDHDHSPVFLSGRHDPPSASPPAPEAPRRPVRPSTACR